MHSDTPEFCRQLPQEIYDLVCDHVSQQTMAAQSLSERSIWADTLGNLRLVSHVFREHVDKIRLRSIRKSFWSDSIYELKKFGMTRRGHLVQELVLGAPSSSRGISEEHQLWGFGQNHFHFGSDTERGRLQTVLVDAIHSLSELRHLFLVVPAGSTNWNTIGCTLCTMPWLQQLEVANTPKLECLTLQLMSEGSFSQWINGIWNFTTNSATIPEQLSSLLKQLRMLRLLFVNNEARTRPNGLPVWKLFNSRLSLKNLIVHGNYKVDLRPLFKEDIVQGLVELDLSNVQIETGSFMDLLQRCHLTLERCYLEQVDAMGHRWSDVIRKMQSMPRLLHVSVSSLSHRYAAGNVSFAELASLFQDLDDMTLSLSMNPNQSFHGDKVDVMLINRHMDSQMGMDIIRQLEMIQQEKDAARLEGANTWIVADGILVGPAGMDMHPAHRWKKIIQHAFSHGEQTYVDPYRWTHFLRDACALKDLFLNINNRRRVQKLLKYSVKNCEWFSLPSSRDFEKAVQNVKDKARRLNMVLNTHRK